MSTLLELQRQIEAAVRSPSSCDAPSWLSAAGLAVYRNNLREGARKALVADYPVIACLVGDLCFRSLAETTLAAIRHVRGTYRTSDAHFRSFWPGILLLQNLPT